jgi:leader peptidase (prepilin peptidase)/N-methyltransferase
MQAALLVYTIFGLIIGSFLNVCIYRIPRKESVVFPASHCPSCGKPIRFYDNVPVLSYLLLRGKCRACGAAISPQYPLVEILTALAFFACALKWNFSTSTYVNSLFLSVIIILVFTDYHHRILPNVLTLPGIIAGILLSPFQDQSLYAHPFSISFRLARLFLPTNPNLLLPWVHSLLGAIVGGGSLLLVALAYEKIRKRQGLGMGDVKMTAMVGAFLGWPLALLTIFAGSFFGSCLGFFLILFRKADLQTKLALGVFLGIGSAISLFYGLSLVYWYLKIPR